MSALASRPAPETPLLASTTTSSISPARASGASARMRRRGVAARRGDDPHVGARRRRGELGAVQLGQPVDGRRQQVRARVLEAVPARVVGRIAQPEVRPEIDHRQPRARAGRRPARRRRRGAGQEDRVEAVGQRRRRCEAGGGEVRDGSTRSARPRGRAPERHHAAPRMPREQAHQLATAVARGADDHDALTAVQPWPTL